EIRVDEYVTLGGDDQVVGQLLAADVVEIAGDAKRRNRGSPGRVDLRVSRTRREQGQPEQCPAEGGSIHRASSAVIRARRARIVQARSGRLHVGFLQGLDRQFSPPF